MRSVLRKLILIFFCLYSLFFFVGSTLAPIMAHFKQYELSAILTSTYMFSCHQQPDRSFWLLGYPIALCCRCYGFYLGVVLSSITALYNRLKMTLKSFIILLVICTTDIIINYGLRLRLNTGNITRFIIGILMGILFITGLDYILKPKRRSKNED